jgi:hypothetical protein
MANEKNKKKGPKKISTRKRKTSVTELSGINPSEALITQEQALQVEDVIKQAFLRFYDNATVKQHKVKDLEHLDNIVGEFLKAFMILGYDLNGEKVCIMHAVNPHDRDALIEHLRTTLLGIINSNG